MVAGNIEVIRYLLRAASYSIPGPMPRCEETSMCTHTGAWYLLPTPLYTHHFVVVLTGVLTGVAKPSTQAIGRKVLAARRETLVFYSAEIAPDQTIRRI